jgi:hypothetical protein
MPIIGRTALLLRLPSGPKDAVLSGCRLAAQDWLKIVSDRMQLLLVYLLSLHYAAVAQKKATRPEGAVPGDAFKKNPDGSWTTTRDAAPTIGALHVSARANTTLRVTQSV